jgi:hypothetical protein
MPIMLAFTRTLPVIVAAFFAAQVAGADPRLVKGLFTQKCEQPKMDDKQTPTQYYANLQMMARACLFGLACRMLTLNVADGGCHSLVNLAKDDYECVANAWEDGMKSRVGRQDTTYTHCGLPWLESFYTLSGEVKLFRDEACKEAIKVSGQRALASEPCLLTSARRSIPRRPAASRFPRTGSALWPMPVGARVLTDCGQKVRPRQWYHARCQVSARQVCRVAEPLVLLLCICTFSCIVELWSAYHLLAVPRQPIRPGHHHDDDTDADLRSAAHRTTLSSSLPPPICPLAPRTSLNLGLYGIGAVRALLVWRHRR